METAELDLKAVFERDPACKGYVQPFLFFKGFLALQTHRVAHWLYGQGRETLAFYLQSRSSELFQVDINPATKIGRGVFVDHGTGIVIGETAVIGDDVSMLQGVTLGGTGAERGDRHPKIGKGVLLGAGAKVLGNIKIGDYAKVASGSVVLKDVPAGCTAAGVPARLVNCPTCDEPAVSPDPRFRWRGGFARSRAGTTDPEELRVDERAIRKIEGHLRGTFANARITLVPRPKQKDSAEVYVGEEFIGVVFEDEDGDGSYVFNMSILAEDLP